LEHNRDQKKLKNKLKVLVIAILFLYFI
jgi:hypothetical protein